MGDKSFTLFEINLHEPSFSASGPIPDSARQWAEDAVETDDGLFQSINVMDGDAEDTVDEDDDVDIDDDVETDEDAESSGRGRGSTVVGLLLLAALAVAKKVLSGDDIDELAELDDLTDISVSDAEEAVEDVEETEEVEDAAEADDGESSGRSKSGILVALVLLGALIVAKKAMSGDGLAELEDLAGDEDDEDGDHDAALDTDENDEAATSIVDDADADDEDGDHDAALDDEDEE